MDKDLIRLNLCLIKTNFIAFDFIFKPNFTMLQTLNFKSRLNWIMAGSYIPTSTIPSITKYKWKDFSLKPPKGLVNIF